LGFSTYVAELTVLYLSEFINTVLCITPQETPVHYASKRGIPTLVCVLQQFGARLDVKDGSGKTPVHNAAQTGSV